MIHLKETDSTNRFLQMLAESEDLPSGKTVLADCQTSGRGQQGNRWHSQAGLNLTFSVLLRPARLPADRFFAVSETAALSVGNTLRRFAENITLKWPNDVYCRDGKICGILIENTLEDGYVSQSVIGIGLNVNQTVFGENIPNAVSLAVIRGETINRMEVMDCFQREFSLQSARLQAARFDEIHADYLASLYRKDGFHKYRDAGGDFEARIFDVEPSGRLVLERTDGRVSKYTFKEVQYQK